MTELERKRESLTVCHQFPVASLTYDFALIQHQDLVGLLHGTDPLGDDEFRWRQFWDGRKNDRITSPERYPRSKTNAYL